jgi:hypothetical protein
MAASSLEANRNCRPGEDRHPERVRRGGGAEGTLFGLYVETETHNSEQGEEKANRNIRQFRNRVK